MRFKSFQIFLDLKKADVCKKWWICSKNPRIIIFCVFLCFSVISCDLPGVAGHALCLQVSSVYQSINQWAPVTHHPLFCFSGLAMSLSAACRRLANVFFCLPCFLDPFHLFIPLIWNPTLNKVICAKIPIFSFFQTVHTKPLCNVLIHWLVVFNVFLFSIVHVWIV